MKLLELFLGILTAVGGFVEIGEVIFMTQAGAAFRYRLLWVVLLGTVGIILFGELSGRIGAVTHQPVFYLIRQQTTFGTGLTTLFAANAVCLLTCTAEIGGMALILKMAMAAPRAMLVAASLLLLIAAVWFLSFQWIERVFGLIGLCMVVFPVAAWQLQPDWSAIVASLAPSLPGAGEPGMAVYAYYAVGLFSSILLPYEIYFYSSGGIEDQWKPADLFLDRIVATVGFSLGSLLAAGILIASAIVFFPRGVRPESLGEVTSMVTQALGPIGFAIALIGLFFAFAGAAIETGLSGAYNTAQFFGWNWGKIRKPIEAPRFTLSWLAFFIAAAIVMFTNVNPIDIVEYSVIFSVVILPLSYYPVLRVASDKRVMKQYAAGPVMKITGWIFWALITIAGIAAVPLMIYTHGGKW